MPQLPDWLRRHDRDRDAREEFETHLALETERQVANGLTPDDAANMARRKFGNALGYREEMRDTRWVAIVERFWLDLKHALRALGHRPLATGAAIVALALGMGGPTALLLMLVNLSRAVYAQVHDPDAVVVVSETPPARPNDRQPATDGTWRVWEPSLVHETAGVALAQPPLPLAISWRGLPERIAVQPIDAALLPLLGVRVAQGRGFVESDRAAGADPVALISDTFWKARFGASETAIGSAVTIDGTTRTVVGVMPRAFWVTTRDVDVWVPLEHARASDTRLFVVTRLQPGDSSEALAKRLQALSAQVAAANPAREDGWGVRVAWLGPRSILHDALTAPGFLMIVAAGVLSLLVACANVAMLMVARGAARQKETAVRTALGASRARVIRQFLLESTLVSIGGGVLMLVVVYAVMQLLLARAGTDLALGIGGMHMDWRVVAGSLGVATLVGLLAGAAPSLTDSRIDVMAALKETGFFSSAAGRQRLRRALLVGEVALTVMLLAVVGLLARGAVDLEKTPPGFDVDRLLVVRADPTEHIGRLATPPPPARTAAARVRRVPGVVAVAAAEAPPPGLGARALVTTSGTSGDGSRRVADRDYVNAVSSEYFATLGLDVLAGRTFGESADPEDGVAVVAQAFARRRWPGATPIGQTLTIDGESTPRLVLGVVSDQLLNEGRRLAAPLVFIPLTAARERDNTLDSTRLLVRVAADAPDVVQDIRQAMTDGNPLQTVRVIAVQDILIIGAQETRAGAVLASPLMLLALLLTVSGVYGLLAQNVAQRTHELALRVTLGAGRRDLFRLVVREGLTLAGAGGVCGITAALIVDQFLGTFLLAVPGEEPFALAGAALTMMLATAIAALVPYRRALAIDPGRILRYE